MKSVNRVGIVIVNWNGEALLERCLTSLKKQSEPNFEICFVDNGSHDSSLSVLAQYFPDAHVIKNPKNLGFAPATNQGLRYLLNNPNIEYVVALNNDTEVTPSWLSKLVQYMDQHPDLGSAQGIVRADHDRSLYDSTGIYLEKGFIPYQRDFLSKEANLEKPVIGPNGAGAIYRRQMLVDIQEGQDFFDSSFFAYVEDVDLALRAQLRGWDTGIANGALMYHVGSATGNKMSKKKMYLGARNLVILVVKNAPLQILLKYGLLILRSHIANIQFLLRDNPSMALVYTRGVLVGLLRSPLYLLKRRLNLNRRKISIKELDDLLVPSRPPIMGPLSTLRAMLRALRSHKNAQ